MDVDTGKKDTIILYSEKCLSCKYLIDTRLAVDLTKEKECHYSEGNDRCPAKQFVVTKGFDMVKAATSLAKAVEQKKSVKVEKIMKRLEKYHPSLISAVKELAKTL